MVHSNRPASVSSAAAREAARRRNGEFGTQQRAEANIDLSPDLGPDLNTDPFEPLPDAQVDAPVLSEPQPHVHDPYADPETLDLSDWTPVEVDTTLAQLYVAEQAARTKKSRAYENVRHTLRYNILHRGYRDPDVTADEVRDHLAEAAETPEADRTYHQKNMLAEWDKVEAAQDEIDDITGQQIPYHAEYRRRPWPRAFVVTNAGGHVHSSMECSTCYPPRIDARTGEWKPGTEFYWATEMSGASEDEIVAASGSGACTVCFKSAPLDVLSRPRTLLAPSEVAAIEAREERARAKEARDAAKIAKALTPDGSEFRLDWTENLGSGGTPWKRQERFKTEQAATQWAVGVWVDQNGGYYKPDPAKLDAMNKVIDAIATKHGTNRDEVMVEIEKKARAKAKRDGNTPWW